jgi:adenylosuccinate lyase
MIDRYSRKEMKAIWSEENKYKAWLEVELLTVEAYAHYGMIPKEDAKAIRDKACFTVDRILEIEESTKHDVVAFTRAVSESLGDEKKWVHYGLTSTDVCDTAYGYLFKQANKILNKDLLKIRETLKNKALEYKYIPIIGRTHGIHGEPTALGLKFALWFEEMNRNIERFDMAKRQIEVGKISGAVGNFAHSRLEIEEYVCEHLGIDYAKISTQVLQRDRHAFYLSTLAIIASSLEKMAVEVRHWQRTEVQELSEFFSEGQKGSSAMPHKRNPIGSENITGCARVIRGYMLTAFENIPLWHERDISHSAPERIIMPDATILLDYALNRFNNILTNILVFEDNMMTNINKTNGLIYSQRVMLSLIDKGWSREKAYDIIQPLAMKSYKEKISYRDLLAADKEITSILNLKELNELFNPGYYLRNVDNIYKRIGLVD